MALKVAPGQWVPLLIPAGAQKAKMAFGGEQPLPAFIDNVQGRRGVETYAKRRCPNLRPGVHKVLVYTDDQVSESTVQVV